MEDQIISFETAKLAKEAGFWIEKSQVFVIGDNAGTRYVAVTSFRSYEDVKKKYFKEDTDSYLYPTQSLLQKWIREEHGIHISIRRLGLGDHVEYNDFIYPKHSAHHTDDTLGNEWDTYEEALENALKEALKLIQNDKVDKKTVL